MDNIESRPRGWFASVYHAISIIPPFEARFSYASVQLLPAWMIELVCKIGRFLAQFIPDNQNRNGRVDHNNRHDGSGNDDDHAAEIKCLPDWMIQILCKTGRVHRHIYTSLSRSESRSRLKTVLTVVTVIH